MKPIGDFPPSVSDLRSAPPPVWLVNLLKWLFPMAVLLFIALIAIPGVLQKWLWMRQLDYGGIFWTLLSVKVVLTCAGFIFALLFLWLNVLYAARSSVARVDSETSKGAGSAREIPQVRRTAFPLISAAAPRLWCLPFPNLPPRSRCRFSFGAVCG